MKRISAIIIFLLFMIGMMAEAQAVTSGVFRCNVLQGPTDDPNTFIVPVGVVYNPNATGVQHITRLRIFDSIGTLILDESYPPGTNTVPPRGSQFYVPVPTGAFEGLQFIVNWRQGADAAAPIVRLILLLFNASSGIYTSVAQSNC